MIQPPPSNQCSPTYPSENAISLAMSACSKKPPIRAKQKPPKIQDEDGIAQQNLSIHSKSMDGYTLNELLNRNDRLQFPQWASDRGSGSGMTEATLSVDYNSHAKTDVDTLSDQGRKSRYFQMGNVWIPMNGKVSNRQLPSHPRMSHEKRVSIRRRRGHRHISSTPVGENTSNSHLHCDLVSPSAKLGAWVGPVKSHRLEMSRDLCDSEFIGKMRAPRQSHVVPSFDKKHELNVLFQRMFTLVDLKQQVQNQHLVCNSSKTNMPLEEMGNSRRSASPNITSSFSLLLRDNDILLSGSAFLERHENSSSDVHLPQCEVTIYTSHYRIILSGECLATCRLFTESQ